MAGNSSIQGNQTVTHTDNLSFDGTDRGGAMYADGQLWIGSATANRPNNGGHVRLGNIVSSDGSITVINGPGSIDLSGTAQPFSPNSALQEFDDFISSNPVSDSNNSKLVWKAINTNPFRQIAGTANHPGIWQSNTAANSGLYLDELKTGTNTGPFVLGGGILSINWVVQLAALSGAGNTYRFSCGLADATSLSGVATDAFVDGCYFQYTDTVNSGNWQIKNTASSVTTTANTSTAASTSFVTLSVVVNADATSVAYYINGNQVANSPLTTNIPTTSLTPFFLIINTAGTNPLTNVDLFWVTQALTNPRPGPTPGTSPTTYTLRRQYTPTAVSYQVLNSDSVIGVTDTSAARTITMPASPTQGEQWTVKDVSLGAATNNITIDGNGWTIISDVSAGTFDINTDGGSADIFFTGSEFLII